MFIFKSFNVEAYTFSITIEYKFKAQKLFVNVNLYNIAKSSALNNETLY